MDAINGNNATDSGFLQVSVVAGDTMKPLQDARVSISYSGEPETDIEQLVTDSDGQTDAVELAAPPVEYSMEPGDVQPYAEYSVTVTASGYESFNVSGISLFADTTALQGIRLVPRNVTTLAGNIVIPANTLWGNFPPKIAEAETKPVGQPGEIVLSRVVVPEYIIVHDGVPTDSTARNYYERFTDYIKNVASSEIYSTWPDATLRANILAIISFTLNRVYTEWYRNRGYDFTITSSTAFDHKWIPERNIFEPISVIVDELFADYLSRPNVRQPILTQYCDGRRVSCPNWLTQWGSKSLGEQGFSPIEILRYYYGDDMYINTAEAISGIPSSWPGYTLEQGSQGPKVRQIQEELNVIAGAYPEIPKLTEDGIYGPETEAAVRKFQSIFGLPVTGEIDYKTWYKISEIYVGVSRIAELS